jgi:glucokinase
MTDGTRPRDLLVGVDVGGSKIAVLVVDPQLRPRARFTLPTRVGAPDSAADAIAGAIRTALGDAGLDVADVAAVGVGVPGRVDPSTGTVSLAVNLGWHDLPLGPQLADRLGVPVGLENDVRAAAAGLFERGVLGDVDDLAFVSIGTGIAAGVILDGRLHRGRRGLAGEIGHIVLEPGGRECACGLRGCLEALAAGPAIAAAARDAVASGRDTSLARVDAPSAIDVYAAASAGDAVATGIAASVGRHIARAIHELVMVYDVEVIVLGGGVARAGDAFLAPILRALDAMRESSSLAREVLRPGVVHLLPPAAEAGSWGGVALARSAAGTDRRAPVAGREVGDA